ncbi:MAG: L,D-transpeptidase family protein [Defluviimonas sp.]|nr:L,D-transpeptidase family protein [Defluviimonas sp.]
MRKTGRTCVRAGHSAGTARRAGALLALMAALALAPHPAAASADTAFSPFAQGVAEAAGSEAAIAAFYRDRGYAPLWTTAEDAPRRAALFAALDRAGVHGLPAARYDAGGLRSRIAAIRTERDRARAEVALSRAFLAYARDVSSGALEPRKIDAGIVREVHRPDPAATLAAFALADPAAFMRALPPAAPEYAQLMKAAMDLRRAAAADAWGAPVSAAGSLGPGASGAAVVQLRDRLIAMGYLGRSATQDFDAAVHKAVQAFQIDTGLTPDGVAGAGTIAEINRSPEDRLKSVLAALERLRWMNGTDLGERHIWVNLPDFSARIVDHGKVTFETVTVVGMNQSDRRTPEFSDQMEYMVVNPTWNVPRSITVKEYLPMLQRNPNAAGHLKIVDRSGRVVNRGAVDFAQYSARTFPFSMKQPPSNSNALGLVKFMFPNQYNIYLHDTPSKSLFDKEIRAFSHGCIRLGRPFDFAYALLARQTDDPEAEFRRYLNTGVESSVSLDQPVPVHLVYFTAWPTPRGRIEYRRDIYGRDGLIFDALQAAGLSLGLDEG